LQPEVQSLKGSAHPLQGHDESLKGKDLSFKACDESLQPNVQSLKGSVRPLQAQEKSLKATSFAFKLFSFRNQQEPHICQINTNIVYPRNIYLTGTVMQKRHVKPGTI